MKKLFIVIAVLFVGIAFLPQDGFAYDQNVFQPRTTKPGYTNKRFIKKTDKYGGYNIYIDSNPPSRPTPGSVLPNCTAYCWGRAYEILGKAHKLPWTDAKNWYSEAKAAGFKVGQTPKVGSIMCWGGGGHGHVAVVEIIANGKITLSESNYNTDYFFTTTKTLDELKTRSPGGFQGFIYLGNFKQATGTTIYYNNHGGNSYTPETIKFGDKFYTPSTSDVKSVGYTLKGFYYYRNWDSTFKIYNKSKGDYEWVTQAAIDKNGYSKYVFDPGSGHKMSKAWVKNGDFYTYQKLTAHAVWKANGHKISFSKKGATSGKAPASKTVKTGGTIVIPGKGTLKKKYIFQKAYTFKGWTIKRNADKKYYSKDGGWYADNKTNKKKHPKRVYKPKQSFKLTAKAWLSNSMTNTKTSFTFTPVWEKP